MALLCAGLAGGVVAADGGRADAVAGARLFALGVGGAVAAGVAAVYLWRRRRLRAAAWRQAEDERRQADAARRASESLFQTVFDNAGIGILVGDLRLRRIVAANAALGAMLGYRCDELVGLDMEGIKGMSHPDDFEVDLTLFQELLDGKRERYSIEKRYVRKDGRLFWGRLTVSLVRAGDERPALSVGMLENIDERKCAEAALQDSESRYRQLVETVGEGIWMIDRDAQTTFVNPRMAEMLGYTVDEMIGRHLFAFMDAANIAQCQENLEHRRQGLREQHDFEFVRQDGRRVYTTLEAAPIFDAAGAYAGAIAGVTDITERRRAEDQVKAALAEKEIMLKELHHRVKNNLQVISSLLHLQSETIEDAYCLELFREAQHRIRSMAMIHENLYQSRDLAHVDFAAYVRRLTENLVQSYWGVSPAIRWSVEHDAVWLGVDAAIPCGLIVNELVSNALKHAFVRRVPESGAEQRAVPAEKWVRVEVRYEAAEPRRLWIVVADNGVGLPPEIDPARTKSLGLQLVHTLTRQLDGQLDVERADGTRVCLRFPV